MREHYDVIIAGGGVTGASAACFLAANPDFGGTILLVERDPSYANAPSARATGGFRQQFSTPENILIGLFGAHFLKHLDRYLAVGGEVPDVAFRERGYLLLATEATLPRMLESNALQRELGADVHFQSPEALATRFPWLSTAGIAGGFLGLSNEGWVDPYLLLQAYRRKARSAGVEVLHDEVIDVVVDGGRVIGVTLRDGGTVGAGTVINAAGASGGRRLCERAGVTVPIESRKRCTFVFECRQTVGDVPMTILPAGVGFRPEGRGFIANLAPPPEHDPETDDTDIDHWLFEERIWPALAERVPAFEAIRLANAWCCHYDLNTFDENLIIGPAPEPEGFLLALGFSGHGLQQSPAVGRALSELVTFGEYRTLDLARLGYQRVPRGERIVETNCY